MKKNVHGNRFQGVAVDGAVDWDHPLNRGRLGWWYAPPGVPFGGDRFRELTRRRTYATATTNNNTTASPMMPPPQKGITVNGSNQYMSVAGTYTFTAISMAAWVYMTANATTAAGIVFNRNGAGTASGLNTGGVGNALNFAWNDDSNTYDHDGAGINLHEWTFVLSTLDPTTLWNYVGTAAAGLRPVLNTFATANASGTRDQWEIGRDNIGRFFTGSIRDVSIWNRALTAPEVARCFELGLKNYQTADSPLRWFSTRSWSLPASGPPAVPRPGEFDTLISSPAWFDQSRSVVGLFDPDLVTVPETNAAAVETADTLSAAATAAIGITATITETADTSTSAAVVAIVSAAAITETADTSAFAATVALAAVFATTEGADALDNSGVVAATIIGISALTPESADTAVSAGVVALAAASAVTETADTLAAAGTVALAAASTPTEGHDTSAFAATVALAAASAVTETPDTSTSVGVVSVKADSSSATASDTFAGTALVTVGTALAATELPDVLDCTVTTLGGLLLDATPTEGADSSTAAATVTLTVGLAATEGADTLASTATTLAGLILDAAIVEGGDTTDFAATLALVASSAVTEGADAVSFSATTVGGLVANLSVTTGGDSFVSLILAGTSHQSFLVSAFSPDAFGMAL